jgi:transcriptional regulator with XRE-family HTH domain
LNKPGPRKASEVDVHLGARLRRRRRVLGKTQTDVAVVVGIGHRQVQKFECASNKMSAAILFRIACALDVPVTYFFEGLST